MFRDFPDVVTVEHVMAMLGIGKSTVYSLLRANRLRHVRVGAKYIIPKKSVVAFADGLCYNGAGSESVVKKEAM